jgi:hypothetical protein
VKKEANDQKNKEFQMSTTTPLKVVAGLNKEPDNNVIARGHAVVKGMKGKPAFPNPPVDPAVLEVAVNNYALAAAEALVDGGKKAIAAKKKQRGIVIPMLKKLAHYVQEACNNDNDMVTLKSSGFEAAATTKVPSQALDQPSILKVDHGNPGELEVTIKPVKKARHYEVRSGVMAGGTTAPTSWTTETVPSARPAPTIKGLTPGTTYAIQVRAYGKVGYTGWSDPAIRICT